MANGAQAAWRSRPCRTLALTPFGAGIGPVGVPQADGARALLTELSAQFNTALLAGLDGRAPRSSMRARCWPRSRPTRPPTASTNVTTPACNATIIGAITGGLISDGSSLFCNASPAELFTSPPPAGPGLPNSLNGLTPGASASTYLFADSVHPTTAVTRSSPTWCGTS